MRNRAAFSFWVVLIGITFQSNFHHSTLGHTDVLSLSVEADPSRSLVDTSRIVSFFKPLSIAIAKKVEVRSAASRWELEEAVVVLGGPT